MHPQSESTFQFPSIHSDKRLKFQGRFSNLFTVAYLACGAWISYFSDHKSKSPIDFCLPATGAVVDNGLPSSLSLKEAATLAVCDGIPTLATLTGGGPVTQQQCIHCSLV